MRYPFSQFLPRASSQPGSIIRLSSVPTFSFSAVDPRGARRIGVREASSRETATDALREEGLFVLDLREAKAGLSNATRRSWWLGQQELLDVSRTLAALLPAGLPLPRALDAARRMVKGDLIDGALADVRERIERGERLAHALAAYPSVFPRHYIGLIRAGENVGDLGGAFARLSEQLEAEAKVRNRLLSAALYPLILAAAGGTAMLVLLVVVLPNFAALLTDTGAELPSSTALVLGVSGALKRYWPVIPILLLVPTITVIRLRSRPDGRLLIDSLIHRTPIIGSLLRDAEAARFARVTGTLLSGGAPLLAALDDACAAATGEAASAAATRVKTAVRDGAPLNHAMQREGSFPPLLAQLTAVGEESARLGEFLLKAAQLFEERTERTVQRLVSLAEPAMIVVFGGVIGFVALSLLQAIYSVNAGSFR